MSKYETPDYEVLIKDGAFEIRKYVDFSIVEYEDASDPEITKGFRSLFKYISSDNKENEKISMTVPVIQEVTKEMKKMAFVVPGKFTEQIPEPNNPNLKIKPFDEGLFGTIRYSGLSNETKELEMKNKLEAWILENGYKRESNDMLASYNAPFTLPMLRRNEIWVRVVKE
ncbi:heme-binding protein [Jeotgalibaca sp. MA1X17-3]|uniref:SOUL family heme-binding protein n=1 Tax=Jeotgalibaca sp. MA1X17-3 TaxID=2908211 RepID=UPI001F1A9B1E|nr:heme-binding protein [Jeotgalibaca sp. MA1X17-3]UJF15418.1 heme-binding protein [Jeotgalibaca sp. MA1X17-3]